MVKVGGGIGQDLASELTHLGLNQPPFLSSVCNTHLLGDLGHALTMKNLNFKIIHFEIASEAIFCHKYNSFSLTCMLASCPHETCDRT